MQQRLHPRGALRDLRTHALAQLVQYARDGDEERRLQRCDVVDELLNGAACKSDARALRIHHKLDRNRVNVRERQER
jgi:hypothetical protein